MPVPRASLLRSDPLSIFSSNNLATTLFCARRCGAAIREARRNLRMDPNSFLAWLVVGACESERGNPAEAVSDIREVLERGFGAEVVGWLANAQARAGRLGETRSTLAELERIEQADRSAGVALARVYAGLGERKQTIERLRRAAEAHLADVAFMGVDPVFDPLRGEAEFQALCAR